MMAATSGPRGEVRKGGRLEVPSLSGVVSNF